jgi:hypothetical protein
MSWSGPEGAPGPPGGSREDVVLERKTSDGRTLTAFYSPERKVSLILYDGRSVWLNWSVDGEEIMGSDRFKESMKSVLPEMGQFLEDLKTVLPAAMVLLA